MVVVVLVVMHQSFLMYVVCVFCDQFHCLVRYLDLETQGYRNVHMVKFYICCILANSLKDDLVFLLV